jgi:hypothetical protein
MANFIQQLVKVLPGAMAVSGLFYIAGGAANSLGVPGVSATAAAAFGLIVGVAHGVSAAMVKDKE